MAPRRAMPNLSCTDLDAEAEFFCDVLGFEVAMDQAGMRMLRSPSVPTTQVLLHAESGEAVDPEVHRVDLSVEVADVDAVYEQVAAGGLEIVYPLTDEPWGVRRFFVRDPGGHVVNVATHVDSLR